jgi:hypothetical protein
VQDMEKGCRKGEADGKGDEESVRQTGEKKKQGTFHWG